MGTPTPFLVHDRRSWGSSSLPECDWDGVDGADASSAYVSLLDRMRRMKLGELLRFSGCRTNCRYNVYGATQAYESLSPYGPGAAVGAYTDQRSVEVSAEAPRYGPTDLLGDVGAILGLSFGASVLGAYDLAAGQMAKKRGRCTKS